MTRGPAAGVRRVAAGIAAAVAIFGMASMAEAAQPAPERAAAPAIPGMTSHFKLKTVEGRVVTEASFPGKWLLIYFGYTRCPDACPTALNAIGVALAELGPLSAQVQPRCGAAKCI